MIGMILERDRDVTTKDDEWNILVKGSVVCVYVNSLKTDLQVKKVKEREENWPS
jgi:uncharacterized membrane protein YcgQ (UPF0703/DUF1980 family)